MIKPTMEEAKLFSKENNVIPIMLEIFADVKTPIEILRRLQTKNDHCYILESVSNGDNWGRYTFLGYNPALTISGTSGIITIIKGRSKSVIIEDSIKLLRKILSEYKSPQIPELPPFTGGLVGYISYDFSQELIPGLKLKAKNAEGFEDFSLMLMDRVIAFDHFKQKIYLIVNISAEELETSYIRGVTELKDMEKLILESTGPAGEEPPVCGEFTDAVTREEFVENVNKIKRHIKEGDIFQAVISNRFKANFKGSLLNTYRILRTTNPSPYMVYLHMGNTEIACSSPETMASLKSGTVSSFPLAGTCPRGKTDEEDLELTEALMKNEKELSEHDMLVDLARNDVGRVSRFGSVKVNKYRQIKRFSHVSHIESEITGELDEGLDALDVITATLPAGTLSGAPKKRACQIIDEVEDLKRGVYGGALGYIDFTGNMDMCIGIRMAVHKGEDVFVRSGAGIVADSDPEREYIESNNKAQAVIDALRNSREI